MTTPGWAVEQGTTRSGSVETDARLAAAAGYSALGFELGQLLDFGVPQTRDVLQTRGLAVSGIQGLPDLFDDPSSTDDRYLAALDAAAVLDASGCLVGTGPIGERTPRAADALVRARLEDIGARAAERGTRVLLEPMHPMLRAWNYVHTLAHAAELTDGLVGVGLAADVGHLWWDRHFLDDIAAHVDRIGIVQLTDVPWAALNGLRYERDRPGTGEIPIGRILRVFHDAGYRGRYEAEILLRMPRDERPQFLVAVRTALDHEWNRAVLD